MPIALNVGSSHGYAVTVELVFERTEAALAAWQLATWSAILDAYSLATSAFDEAASRSVISSTSFGGRNPTENRAMERTELKRVAIQLLNGAVGAIDAVDDEDSAERPTVKPGMVAPLDDQIRNFDTAFEWEHMQWESLDYFWSPSAQWNELMAMEDEDADHKAFLTAGAATVTIPVRPGFETNVLYRLWTGRSWPGERAPFPTIRWR